MQAHAAELAAAIKAEEAQLQLLQAQVWLTIQGASSKHAQLSRPVHPSSGNSAAGYYGAGQGFG